VPPVIETHYLLLGVIAAIAATAFFFVKVLPRLKPLTKELHAYEQGSVRGQLAVMRPETREDAVTRMLERRLADIEDRLSKPTRDEVRDAAESVMGEKSLKPGPAVSMLKAAIETDCVNEAMPAVMKLAGYKRAPKEPPPT
jgi:hypothetical protein